MLETPKPVNRLSSVQALRALAASSVVVFHIVDAILRANPADDSLAALWRVAWLGNFGVDVFFIISGFIMIYAHYDDFGQAGAPQVFLTKRLIRIVPNYWLLTALGTAILFLAPQLSHYGRQADLPWIIASFLFLPWTSSAGIPVPVLGLGWTLNYEMYFYAVFAVALLFSRHVAVLGVTVFFALSIALGTLIDSDNAFVKQATNWLLAEFLLGIFLGLAFKRDWSLPGAVGLVLVPASIVLLSLGLTFKAGGTLEPILRFAFFGLAGAALVVTMTLTPLSRSIRFPAWVLLLGNASYALYLTHAFTVPAMVMVLRRLPVALPGWAMIAVLFAGAALVAVLFYLAFEKPTQRILRGRRTPKENLGIASEKAGVSR